MDKKLWALLFAILAIVLIAPLTVGAQPSSQPKIPHLLEGKEACLVCHGSGLSSLHTGKTEDTCTTCHVVGASSPAATATAGPDYGISPIPHAVAGREDCLMCHGKQGSVPVPADHEGRTNDVCQACHQEGGPAGEPEKTAGDQEAAPTAQPQGGAGVVPHAIAGREDCLSCHVAGSMIGIPADHSGRENSTCLACHGGSPAASATEAVAQVEAATAAISPIPHSLEGKTNCVSCHDTGGMIPFPADHEGRANDTCQSCHVLAVSAEEPAATVEAVVEQEAAGGAAEDDAEASPTTAVQEEMPQGGFEFPVVIGAVAGMAMFLGGIAVKFRRSGA